MKCYLHIGIPKTATTTVQKFLGINRQKLLDKGYIFTQAAGGNNDLPLAVVAYNDDRRDGLTQINGIRTNADMVALRDAVTRNLKTEIMALAKDSGGDPKVILSSEYFQLQLHTVEEVKRLRNIIHSIGIDEIDVIVYLRNPVSLANSYFSTSVKAGGDTPVPPGPLNPRYEQLCNHQSTLERYAQVFGKEHINARIFDRNELVGNSIISDFLSAIGIDDKAYFDEPINSNESLSTEGIALLSRLNRIFPRWIGQSLNPVYKFLVRYMETEFGDGTYMMPKELYEQYVSSYIGSDEWVRQQFFPHKSTLFEYKPHNSKNSLVLSDTELDDKAHALAFKILKEIETEQGIVARFRQELDQDSVSTFDYESLHEDRDRNEMVLLGTGLSFYHLQEYDSALEYFERALAENPASDFTSGYRAMALRELGDYVAAEQLFKVSIKRSDATVRTWLEYAVCADLQGLSVESKDRWTELLALYPNSGTEILERGRSLLSAGHYSAALNCFTTQLAVPQIDTSVRLAYAKCCSRLDQHEAAIKELNNLLAEDVDNIQAQFMKARALISLECFEEAGQVYETLQRLDPNNELVYVEWVKIAVAQSEWDVAAQRWARTAEKFTNNSQYSLNAGICHKRVGQYELALTFFNAVLNEEPANQAAMLNKVQCLSELGEYEAVIKELDKLLAEDVDNIQAQFMKARALISLECFEEAGQVYETLQRLDPSNELVYVEWVKIAVAQSEWDVAAQRWARTAEKFTNNPQYSLNAGICHKRVGQFELALTFFNAVLNEEPANQAAMLNKAQCLSELGEYEAVIKELDKLLAEDVENVQAHFLKARALISLECFEEAGQVYETLQRLDPNNELVYVEWVKIAVAQREWDVAAQRWARTAEKFTNNSQYSLNAGICHKRVGQYELALTFFNTVLNEEPANQAAMLNKAQCLSELDEFDAADKVLIELQSVCPNHIDGITELAILATKQKKWEEAYSRWCAVDALSPNNTRVYFGMASCLMNMKKYKPAAELFLKQVQLDASNEIVKARYERCLALAS